MNTVPDSACGMRLVDLIDRQRIGPEAVLYSLIDGAKHTVLPEDRSVEMFPLLGDAAQSDAIWAGPILIRHAHGEHCPHLAKLLCSAGSANFLSLIASKLPLEILLKRLTWLTDVKHEDGTEWVMRYYNPLILLHWLDVLDPPQRATALCGIEAWWYVDVRSRPQVVGGIKAGAPDELAKDPMLLSNEQCDKLLELTAPYLVMNELENDDANVLSTIAHRDRYDFFAKQLTRAQEYGLTSVTDLKSYCMLAVIYGPTFDKHPVPTAALCKSGRTPFFSAQILEWGAEQWESLEKFSHDAAMDQAAS